MNRSDPRLVEAFALRYRRWAIPRIRSGVQPVLAAARATMHRKKYCLLATTAGDGGINARVLQPFPPDAEFTVWLGTSPASRKAGQLAARLPATLVYEDDARSACVVLGGTVTLVDDLAERRRRFSPFWRAFWPDGPEGPDFILLRFAPSRIEVWDARRRITPIPFGLRSARVVRSEDGTWRADQPGAPGPIPE